MTDGFVARSGGVADCGVFATRDLAAGAVVIPRWHDEFIHGLEGWTPCKVEDVDALPDPQRRLFNAYALDVAFGTLMRPTHARYVTTFDNFINHSCLPNLVYDHAGNVITRERVRSGHELLIDYGYFSVNVDAGFTCRCAASGCRGEVLKDDWKTLARTRRAEVAPFVRAAVAITRNY
jgi:SET domain